MRTFLTTALTGMVTLTSVARTQQSAGASSNSGKITPPTVIQSGHCDSSKLPPATHPYTVTVEFIVGVDGTSSEVRVTKSNSPGKAYDNCVLEIVRTTQFAPARQNGKPVSIKMVLDSNVPTKAGAAQSQP